MISYLTPKNDLYTHYCNQLKLNKNEKINTANFYGNLFGFMSRHNKKEGRF